MIETRYKEEAVTACDNRWIFMMLISRQPVPARHVTSFARGDFTVGGDAPRHFTLAIYLSVPAVAALGGVLWLRQAMSARPMLASTTALGNVAAGMHVRLPRNNATAAP